jgi:hypothetical protein
MSTPTPAERVTLATIAGIGCEYDVAAADDTFRAYVVRVTPYGPGAFAVPSPMSSLFPTFRAAVLAVLDDIDADMAPIDADPDPDAETCYCPACDDVVLVAHVDAGPPSMLGHGADPDVLDLTCGHTLTWNALTGDPIVRDTPPPASVEPMHGPAY